MKDLTDNVNSMAGNLTGQVRNIAEVSTAIASGDLSRKITVDVRGEILQLKETINTMVDQLRSFASEVTRVAREVGTEGKLGGQAVVPGVAGTWKDLTDSVNSMAGNLTGQVRNIAEVATAIANGDLSRKITADVKGEILQLKESINTMVDQLNAFAAEVTRVAREVGTEGNLGGQAEVKGVSGVWKDLTDNVNSMASNLTDQVRNIAEVATAIGRGVTGEKVNILLVDDQPARLLTYQSVLRDLDQNLVSARSGAEALEKLMRQEFAVVLLDVSMPDMDGFEAARLIHDHPRFERTPIIFVTGVHMSELDRLKGYKLGAVDYVSIPVVPEILRSKVSVLVELYCKRRELRELNRHLAEANTRLAQATTALEAEKTRELETLNASLQSANADLERANRALQSEVGERARAEEALKEADRHKDEFLAMLAHELRNPLAPIRNAVHLMKMKTLDDPQVGLSRDIIERQLAHLTRLVDDLLDVSRITRGKINLTRQRLEIGELLDRAVETVEPAIRARGHRLSVDIVDRAHAVYGDPLRLTQAIANILGNAAKYTECGGQIDVRCRRRNRDIEICVRDTGIGIAPEVLPRIFDLFTQLDHRLERSHSGLGIGLALVRRLVEMHGGTVAACSEGPGCGSEFVVRLPLSIELTASERGEASEAEPQTRVSDVRRILIADDNADALESLATLLSLNGHQVFRAPDGEAALRVVEQLKPEIALLDIGMPRVDGYEVARRIRTIEGGKASCW